jgi:hypothetical protein
MDRWGAGDRQHARNERSISHETGDEPNSASSATGSTGSGGTWSARTTVPAAAHQVIPVEMDANAAAATFVRGHFGADRIDELLAAGDPRRLPWVMVALAAAAFASPAALARHAPGEDPATTSPRHSLLGAPVKGSAPSRCDASPLEIDRLGHPPSSSEYIHVRGAIYEDSRALGTPRMLPSFSSRPRVTSSPRQWSAQLAASRCPTIANEQA